MLTTPENIRTLQRKLYRKASADNGGLDEGACFVMKNIGKPCAGKPQARFDEGGLVESYDVASEAPPNERGAYI
ncbi:MAG: hypothetical protein ABIE74_05965 [Pseudomonadota bacterium]